MLGILPRKRIYRWSQFDIAVLSSLACAVSGITGPVAAATPYGTVAPASRYDCVVEARLEIKLATPVAGVLKDVTVDRGDVIHKGDILAKLDSGVEEALLELAKARAENDATVKAREARIVFLAKKRERTARLQGKGDATTAALDEIESDFNVANQELREAQSNTRIAQLDVIRASEVLKQRTIVSPIDGVVSKRNLLGGEYAYEQAPIMTIDQIDPLNVEVFLPVKLYGSVKVGMQLTVDIGEARVGGKYNAAVEIVDPLIEARSGTFGVRLLLPNPQKKIPAGLRCTVEFPVPADEK